MRAWPSVFAAAALLMWQGAPLRASDYDDLVAKAENDPARADYTALRMAYAASPHYDPYSLEIHNTISDMWQAFGSGDCKMALEKSVEILRANYTFLSAHAIRGACLKKAGDSAGAAHEMAVGRGLAVSVLKSGDGRTPKTAFIVVTLDEEEFVLAHIGLAEERQALLSSGGHSYDEIDGTLKGTGGKKAAALFQIDLLLEGEAHQLKLPH